MKRICSIPACQRPHAARGYCNVCYRQAIKAGIINVIRPQGRSIEERFWSNVVEDPSGCWIWTGGKTRGGYGQFTPITTGPEAKTWKAHRFAYDIMVGPIPDGLQLDHLCRVRHCVNPEHLEPVTAQVNTLRGIGVSALNAKKIRCPSCQGAYTLDANGGRKCNRCIARRALAKKLSLCKRGHPLVDGNVHIYADGKRRCMTCFRARQEAADSRTHCTHGHALDAASTFIRPEGYRACRTCSVSYSHQSYLRR